MTEHTRCIGIKNSGEPCGTRLGLSAAGLCLSHDPERVTAARESRARGGKATGEAKRATKAAEIAGRTALNIPPAPRNLEDATRYFAWLVDAGATGKLDARTVHECSFALKGFQSAAEKRDLEREIKALRKQLDELTKQPRRAS